MKPNKKNPPATPNIPWNAYPRDVNMCLTCRYRGLSVRYDEADCDKGLCKEIVPGKKGMARCDGYAPDAGALAPALADEQLACDESTRRLGWYKSQYRRAQDMMEGNDDD